MFTEFLLCFCLWTNVHPAVIPTPTSTPTTAGLVTTTPEPFDEDAEIAKIRASCFKPRDFEQISNDWDERFLARAFSGLLIHESLEVIGLTELRRTLNFPPLDYPWQRPNYTSYLNVSEPTIEAYYNIEEPRFCLRCFTNDKRHENNYIAAVPYVDSRFPSIREMFRCKFHTIFQSWGQKMDTKTIDQMIGGYFVLYFKLNEALTPGRDTVCWDDERT